MHQSNSTIIIVFTMHFTLFPICAVQIMGGDARPIYSTAPSSDNKLFIFRQKVEAVIKRRKKGQNIESMTPAHLTSSANTLIHELFKFEISCPYFIDPYIHIKLSWKNRQHIYMSIKALKIVYHVGPRCFHVDSCGLWG